MHITTFILFVLIKKNIYDHIPRGFYLWFFMLLCINIWTTTNNKKKNSHIQNYGRFILMMHKRFCDIFSLIFSWFSLLIRSWCFYACWVALNRPFWSMCTKFVQEKFAILQISAPSHTLQGGKTYLFNLWAIQCREGEKAAFPFTTIFKSKHNIFILKCHWNVFLCFVLFCF